MGEPICVLDQQGKPLMPSTNHHKVWYWLRKKRARMVSREPFVVQLCFETAHYTQAVTLGVDTGSKVVGVAAKAHGQVLFQGEMQLRTDVYEKMTRKRSLRHARRARKTRYRPSRFLNRKRASRSLPPSLFAKEQAHEKLIHFVDKLLPLKKIHVEVASFDTQKMRTPDITGQAYQQGTLLGYQVREYVLAKWQRRCAYCGKGDLPLQLEHIHPKARGGSDRVDNLTLACGACNRKKGNRTASEFGYPHIQAQAKEPFQDAAHVGAIKTVLLAHLKERFGEEAVQVRYGYETKYQRIQALRLAKSHAHDAVAIACELGEVVEPLVHLMRLRCLSRGSYQLFNGKHSEHKVWAPKRVKGFKLYEIVSAKGQTGYIGGRRQKGSFVLRDLSTGKLLIEVVPSRLSRIMRPQQGWLIWSEIFTEQEEAPH